MLAAFTSAKNCGFNFTLDKFKIITWVNKNIVFCFSWLTRINFRYTLNRLDYIIHAFISPYNKDTIAHRFNTSTIICVLLIFDNDIFFLPFIFNVPLSKVGG